MWVSICCSSVFGGEPDANFKEIESFTKTDTSLFLLSRILNLLYAISKTEFLLKILTFCKSIYTFVRLRKNMITYMWAFEIEVNLWMALTNFKYQEL